MIRKMNWKFVLVLALFPASAFAQLPLSAGYKPVMNASFGYSYVSLPIPSSTRIALNGLDASFTKDFFSRFGAKVDLNYARASNVLGTGHHSDVFSYMLGPLFYPVNNSRQSVYIQALAGYSRIDGVVPDGAGGFNFAYVTGPSWVIGGGIERGISSTFAVRTEADYLHTSFIDSSATFRGQNDIRITSSLVFRWGGRSETGRNHRRFKSS